MRLLAASLLAALSSGTAVASQAISMTATAGIDGVVRPGRWVPVVVTLANGGTSMAGEIVIEWGDRAVRREVALGAGARKEIELYVRSSDPRSSLRVLFEADGIVAQTIDVPVRIAGLAEELAVVVKPDDAPRSWRGYDAADRIDASPADVATLDRGQQSALRIWRAFRELERPGAAPAPVRPHAPPLPRRSAFAALIYAAVLGTVGAVMAARRPARTIFVVTGCVMAIGCAAALAADRLDGRAVVIRHDTVVQVADGQPVSRVWMRAVAQYPSQSHFTLRVPLDGASIDMEPRGVEHLDVSGHPLLSGRRALGERHAFSIEGVLAMQPFAMRAHDGRLRLENTTSVDIEDCAITAAFTTVLVGTLSPGHAADIAVPDDPAATISCVTNTPVVPIDGGPWQVRSIGTTRFVAPVFSGGRP